MDKLESLILQLISGDDQAAEASAEQIPAFGEAALPTLFALLDAPDPDQRWWALRALSLIPHSEVLPRLRDALNDPDPEVRQCAALGLSQQPWEASIPDLIALLDDQDRLLARLAGDALIVVGSPALPALIVTLENDSQAAKIEAARALALIGDTDAISALFKAWQDGSTMLQYWAEEGLDRMGVGMQFFLPDG